MHASMLDIPIGKWTTKRPKCTDMSHAWKKYKVNGGDHPNVVNMGKNLTVICFTCGKCNVSKIKIVERSTGGGLVNLMVLYATAKIRLQPNLVTGTPGSRHGPSKKKPSTDNRKTASSVGRRSSVTPG